MPNRDQCTRKANILAERRAVFAEQFKMHYWNMTRHIGGTLGWIIIF